MDTILPKIRLKWDPIYRVRKYLQGGEILLIFEKCRIFLEIAPKKKVKNLVLVEN